MAYTSNSPMFRSLDDKEEKEFQEYARTHDPMDANDFPISHYDSRIHHPVCCEVWHIRGFKDRYEEESKNSR